MMAKKKEIENLEKTIQKLREKSLAENDALKKLIAALHEKEVKNSEAGQKQMNHHDSNPNNQKSNL
jgi:hypothetical protein